MTTQYSRLFERFGRVKLLNQPTSIQRLHHLEQELGSDLSGVRLYAKRDDVMGLGGGGNKLRKLEFLLGEALSQHCDTFITTGGLQSNHARLSAAACAHLGLRCELALTQIVPRTDHVYLHNGNVLLDELFGATIHILPRGSNALDFAKERAEALKKEGRRPYVVGSGGSSPVGCLGYAACAIEIAEQEQIVAGSFAHIVVPNGSSGTHAGLLAGFTAIGMNPKKVRSYAVLSPAAEARQTTSRLAIATLALLDPSRSISSDAIHVTDDQLGDGYGIPTAAMISTVRLMARTEGLLLDPVYTGKAFAGLLADARRGVFKKGDAILFVMTGGLPGLFAYQPIFDKAS
jgi:L-cysteate sulfo-lyase